MAKRYTAIEPDGKRVRLSEDMFDFIVSAALAKMQRRTPDASFSPFEVARHMYPRPTMATFRNVAAALARLHASDPKRFTFEGVSAESTAMYSFRR